MSEKHWLFQDHNEPTKPAGDEVVANGLVSAFGPLSGPQRIMLPDGRQVWPVGNGRVARVGDHVMFRVCMKEPDGEIRTFECTVRET